METTTPELILERVPAYQAWQVSNLTHVAAFAALIYHYLTTIDEEVKHIWPQPRWKFGKILFLTTRYSVLLFMIGQLTYNVPNYTYLGVSACGYMFRVVEVAAAVSSTAADASLWLCLYALLGARPRYFYLMILLLLGVAVVINVFEFRYILSQQSGPLEPLDEYLGWPCSFTLPDASKRSLYSIGLYIAAARSFAAIALGVVAFFIRYRKQRNNILRVIKREGGLYFALSFTIKFIGALTMTSTVKIDDAYAIIWVLNRVFSNVFAERLLLALRKVDDPGTRAVISSIAFNTTHAGGRDDDGTLQAGDFGAYREGADGLEVVERIEGKEKLTSENAA